MSLYWLPLFALSTTISQSAMDFFEALIWIWGITQLRKLKKQGLSPQAFLPNKILGFIIILPIFFGISLFYKNYSQYSLGELFWYWLEWRWVLTFLFLILFWVTREAVEVQKIQQILLWGTFFIFSSSLAKYYFEQQGIGRADGWIGCMPLGHNLILWAGWLLFDLQLKMESAEKLHTQKLTMALIIQKFIPLTLRVANFVLLFWLLLLTLTRGAWIGAFVFILLTLLIWRKHRKTLALILLPIIILATSQISLIKTRLNQTSLEHDFSTRTRVYFWQGYWELFKQHPLFGAGYPLHRNLYFDKLPSDKQEYILHADPGLKTIHAHNQPLHVLSGIGLVGFLLYYLLLFSPFGPFFWPKSFAQLIPVSNFSAESYRQKAVPLLFSLLAFHIASFTEASLSIAKNRSLYLFALATLWALYLKPQLFTTEKQPEKNS